MELKEIIKRPLTTEKMYALQDKSNKYAFEVDKRANKIEIKHAIEQRFSVKVKDVRTINVLGKMKRFGRYEGRRKSWKKAIVTLQSGQTLDIFGKV
jgi:large subunit ribosomal protein L23